MYQVINKENVLIFDPAHGKDTAGKRSPDGLHREYLWSRERLLCIISNILEKGISWEVYYPFVYHEDEPGLINRVIKYNDIAKDYKESLVISLHNDAWGEGWTKPNGASIWTNKGQDKSDVYAQDWFDF